MATQTSQEAAGILVLEKPAPSEIQSVNTGDQPVQLAFDASEAQIALVDGDLVFRFADGATLIIASNALVQAPQPLAPEAFEIPRPGQIQTASHGDAPPADPQEQQLTLEEVQELLSITPAAGPAEPGSEPGSEPQGSGGEFETPLLHELTSLEALGLLSSEENGSAGAPFGVPDTPPAVPDLVASSGEVPVDPVAPVAPPATIAPVTPSSDEQVPGSQNSNQENPGQSAGEETPPNVPIGDGPGNGGGAQNNDTQNVGEEGSGEETGGPGNGNGNGANPGNEGGNTGGSGPGTGNGGQNNNPHNAGEEGSGEETGGPGNGNGNGANPGNEGGNTGGSGPGTGNGGQNNNPHNAGEESSGEETGGGPGNGNGNNPNSGNGGGNTGGGGPGTGNGEQGNNPHTVVEVEEQSLVALGDLGETLTGFNIAAPSEGGDLLDLSQVLSDYGRYSISFQLMEGDGDIDVAIQVSTRVRGEVSTETLAVIDGGTMVNGGDPVNPGLDFDAQTALADNLMLTVTSG